MSNTPRTDKAQGKTLNPRYEYTGAEYEAWEHSRQLERELEKSNRHKKWLIRILQKVTDYEPARHRDLSRAYEVLRTIEEEDMK